jgi:hypothetical protein
VLRKSPRAGLAADSDTKEDRRVPATYDSAPDLAAALRRAAEAHGKHEKAIGAADPNWPDWYAEFMAQEQAATSDTGAEATT